MGVPSYFSWILKNIKKYGLKPVLHPNLPDNVDRLYLDYNCGIHRICRQFADLSENDMIIKNLLFIEELIKYTNPHNLVYIAIDGSVPFAKCKQQRYRRFKTVKENIDIKNIKKKFGVIEDHDNVDYNMISPGTEFMINLSESIKKEFETWKLKYPHLNFILSDSLVPGEGEHKIIQHIKHNIDSRCDVIYGLDADLIFLSMTLNSKIYLLRENLQFERINDCLKDYLHFSISDLKSDIIKIVIQSNDIFTLQFQSNTYNKEIMNYNEKQIITDYIFINILLGNDFIPRLYSLSIKERGCEILLQIYRCYLRYNNFKHILNDDFSININSLCSFMKLVVEYEYTYWSRSHNNTYCPKINQNMGDLEYEIFKYQLVDKYLRNINLCNNDQSFIIKYYSRLFPIALDNQYQINKHIAYICRQYCMAIKWITEYYFKECIDWNWYYPFNYAPLAQHLIYHLYLINNINSFNMNSKPIDVYHQLMIILPPTSFHLLPRIFKRITYHPKYSIYFPNKYKYDYYGQYYLSECQLKIPILDVESTYSIYNYFITQLNNNEKIKNNVEYRI